MGLKLKNDAISRIASGISSLDTTITLVSGSGVLFPTLSSGDYFPATLIKSDGSREIIRVTARSADVLTVVRAQEGTIAQTFNANDKIELRLTAGTFTDPSGPSATSITSASTKSSPVDADLFGYTDSEDVFKLKKFSWANIKAAVLNFVYPVGSIYINAGSSTNPATLLGFGTWVAFGAGKVMVGLDAGDTSFDTLEETGGSKDAINVDHTHTASTASDGTHTHSVTDPGHLHGTNIVLYGSGQGFAGSPSSWQEYVGNTASATTGISIDSAGAHTHAVTVASAGSSGTNANLQPYVVVQMWKRTA